MESPRDYLLPPPAAITTTSTTANHRRQVPVRAGVARQERPPPPNIASVHDKGPLRHTKSILRVDQTSHGVGQTGQPQRRGVASRVLVRVQYFLGIAFPITPGLPHYVRHELSIGRLMVPHIVESPLFVAHLVDFSVPGQERARRSSGAATAIGGDEIQFQRLGDQRLSHLQHGGM